MPTYSELDSGATATIRRYQPVLIAVALVAELFLAGDWYGFAAVIPFVSKSLNLSASQAGLAQGLFAITYALSLFAWGPLADRVQAKRIIVLGLGGTGLFMVVQGFSHSFGELLFVRGVIGVFDAAVFVGTMKLIASWFAPARRGALMGSLLAAYSLAITGDFAAGIPIAHHFGWQVFLSGLGVLTLLVAAVAGGLIKSRPQDVGVPEFTWEKIPKDSGAKKSLRTVFRQPWIYIAGIAIFGDTFAIAAGATWVIPTFLAVDHISFNQAALVGSVMGLSQVVFLLIGGFFSDRIRRRVLPMRIGAGLAAVSAILFALSAMQRLPILVLFLFAATSGVAVFSGGAIFSMVADQYGEDLAGVTIGYAEIGGILSTFVAPAAMGFLITRTHTFSQGFWLFTGVELVIFAVLVVFVRDYTFSDEAVTQSKEPLDA